MDLLNLHGMLLIVLFFNYEILFWINAFSLKAVICSRGSGSGRGTFLASGNSINGS